jgi:YD repeat-containing protein
MSNFDHNAISLEAVYASQVKLPNKASVSKIFLDKTSNKLMKLDYSGKLELLGANVTFTKAPESGLFYSAQTQKYYHSVNGELLEVDSEGVVGEPTQVAEIFETTIELPQGDKGDKGDKGDTGPQGVAGIDGLNGKDGIEGKPGRDGLNGKDGIDGKPGRDGLNGKDGKSIVGPQGVVGPQGIQGPPGASSAGGVSKSTVIRLINEYSPTGEVSKSFGYNSSDQLILISDSKGTQTFTYDGNDLLINIIGTGSYVSKNFIYDVDGLLTGIEVL